MKGNHFLSVAGPEVTTLWSHVLFEVFDRVSRTGPGTDTVSTVPSGDPTTQRAGQQVRTIRKRNTLGPAYSEFAYNEHPVLTGNNLLMS